MENTRIYRKVFINNFLLENENYILSKRSLLYNEVLNFI